MHVGSLYVSLFILLLHLYVSNTKTTTKKPAICTEGSCRLPDCFCAGKKIPYGYSAKKVPQMVAVIIEGVVNQNLSDIMNKVFSKRKKNPNDCQISGSFFVTHNGTDYCAVNALYSIGHEFGSQGMSVKSSSNWWQNATAKQWENEIVGEKKMLTEKGKISASQVQGMRSQFLQSGGDAQFAGLKQNGFRYDSSLIADEFYWPYTLDYSPGLACSNHPCPKNSYRGLWEIPITTWRNKKGISCTYMDQCLPVTEREVFQLITENFRRTYHKNRAPFLINLKATWLTKHKFALSGLTKFIEEILTLDDVYVVSLKYILDWMEHPFKAHKLLGSKNTFGCSYRGTGCQVKKDRKGLLVDLQNNQSWVVAFTFIFYAAAVLILVAHDKIEGITEKDLELHAKDYKSHVF